MKRPFALPRIIASLLMMTFATFGNASIALAEETARTTSAATEVTIAAPPNIVWNALAEDRKTDPELEYTKLLKSEGNHKTIEQKFTGIPIIGSVVAVTEHVEVPYKSIDYKLVHSDKFKDLSGSWTLTPIKGGKETVLKLSTNIDIGVPFSKFFIKSVTNKKMKKRVDNIKKIAEREASRLAQH